MKRNLGWWLAAAVTAFCMYLGYSISQLEKKLIMMDSIRTEQQALLDTYKERLMLADTTIIVIDKTLAASLRQKKLSASEAADILQNVADSWQPTEP